MPPRIFLKHIALPNLEDLKNNYADERLAFNAIAATDSLAAHIYIWCRTHAPAEVKEHNTDTAYREHLADRNSDFRLLRDLAKVQKHGKLVHGQPTISATTQIEVTSLGWGEARWNEGRWGSPPQVVAKTNAGDNRVVESVMTKAIEFLSAEMDRLGVD